MPLADRLDELVNAIEEVLEEVGREIERAWHRHRHHHHNPPSGVATHAILTLEGAPMPAEINVDSATASLSLAFADDKGDVTGPPNGPDGTPATVTYGSDNPAVATVDPATGQLTGVSAGTFNATANVTNADGTPTLEPDGVTPFSPAPVLVTVDPGAAATDVFTVNA